MKQLFLSTLLNLIFFSTSYAIDTFKISNSYIPEAPPGARVMAGYMEIHNTSNKLIDIVSVSSPSFNSVEMHLSKEVNGTAKMLQQDKLSIPANSKLVLKPGSYHLMLMKPKKRLLNGEKAEINFTLSNKETISINMPVKKKTSANNGGMKCAAGKCGGGKCGRGN